MDDKKDKGNKFSQDLLSDNRNIFQKNIILFIKL